MLNTYFSKERLVYGILLTIVFLLFGLYILSFIFALIIAFIAFTFRKKKIITSDGNLKITGVIKSPIDGYVVSHRTGITHEQFGVNLTELRLYLPHFFESGIYLPTPVEFDDIKKYPSKELFRYQRSLHLDQRQSVYGGVTLKLRTIDDTLYGMQLIKCYLGLSPVLWVLTADRGGSGSRFGFFPFGGTVILYLPSDYDVIIDKGTKLVGGETILARRKGD